MPTVSGGPKGLNSLLERVYGGCMARTKNAMRCSRIAWSAAKGAGWFKGKDGKWHKRKNDESIKDKVDAKPTHKLVYQVDEE